MIVAVGTDIVSVSRIREAMKNPRFIPKVLNNSELLRDFDPEHVAGRWAAKEALIKCLGGTFKDYSLASSPTQRKPIVTSERLGGLTCHLSISHERDFAVAFVVIESRESR